MPTLIIYVPFAQIAGNPGDLRTNAADLVANARVPCSINGVQINRIVAVYANQEAANAAVAGDIVVVHAHGGPGGGGLSDNLGANIALNILDNRLVALNAGAAALVCFAACYSAVANHVGPRFVANNPGPPPNVTAAHGVVQGAIASITRQGTIRNAMFFNADPRMTVLQ